KILVNLIKRKKVILKHRGRDQVGDANTKYFHLEDDLILGYIEIKIYITNLMECDKRRPNGPLPNIKKGLRQGDPLSPIFHYFAEGQRGWSSGRSSKQFKINFELSENLCFGQAKEIEQYYSTLFHYLGLLMHYKKSQRESLRKLSTIGQFYFGKTPGKIRLWEEKVWIAFGIKRVHFVLVQACQSVIMNIFPLSKINLFGGYSAETWGIHYYDYSNMMDRCYNKNITIVLH
ncbi:hypothetical protein ACJX0J_024572, partial [Zea mays]